MNYQGLFDFILQIPQVVASFGSWLMTPINSQWLNISPLGLFSVSGVGLIITLIGIHVVRLFV